MPSLVSSRARVCPHCSNSRIVIRSIILRASRGSRAYLTVHKRIHAYTGVHTRVLAYPRDSPPIVQGVPWPRGGGERARFLLEKFSKITLDITTVVVVILVVVQAYARATCQGEGHHAGRGRSSSGRNHSVPVHAAVDGTAAGDTRGQAVVSVGAGGGAAQVVKCGKFDTKGGEGWQSEDRMRRGCWHISRRPRWRRQS